MILKMLNGEGTEWIGVAGLQTTCLEMILIWKQTSYGFGGTDFRGNYAGIGMTYMTNVEVGGCRIY